MELLIELSTMAGAGALVSLLLDWLREQYSVDTPVGRWLHAPQIARWIALVGSAAVASAASYAVAYFGGPPADPAAQAAWAAVFSQAVHALRHLPPAPVRGEGE